MVSPSIVFIVPFLKRVLVNLLILIWTIPIFLSLVLVGLFGIPFIIYWHLTQLAAKLLRFRPSRAHVTHVLRPLAQLMANDDLHGRPTLNICFCSTVEGTLLPEGCQLRFHNEILSKPEYRELQQFITTFGGYYFWEKDVDFDLKHHIRLYDYGEEHISEKIVDVEESDRLNAPSPCTESDLKRILRNLVLVPWKSKKSPWEFLIIHNFLDRDSEMEVEPHKKEKSLLIFRIHHVLADGYSLHKIMMQVFTGGTVPTVLSQSKRVKDPVKGGIGKTIKTSPVVFPVKCLWDYSKFLWEMYKVTTTNSQGRTNPWKMPLDLKTLKYNLTWSNGIEVSRVKELKRKFGVSFQAVLVSVIAGALRKLMEQADQNIMEEILNFLTFPLPHHPGGLNNHFGINMQKLPLGEKNPVRRLSICADEVKRVKKSTAPYFLFWNLKLLGRFPPFLARRLATTERHKVTLCIAPFSGPSSDSFITGLKVTAPTIYTNGFDRSDTGALVTCLSMFGELRIVLSVRKELYPSFELLDKFPDFIEEELQLLTDLPADTPSRPSFLEKSNTIITIV